MRQELKDHIADMEDVAGLLKNTFVAKDEIIEMMVICAMAQEHLLIVGPPGTAKSEIAKRFAMLCSPEDGTKNGKVPYFEYLLTRFTEPNEIFGPVDIGTFQTGGGHRRVTEGMLPRSEITFLDEVFKANSAILNALLNILNERIFYNGGKADDVPLIFAVGATNEVPDDPTLAALYDRFPVRIWTDNVEESRFRQLFNSGWRLIKDRIQGGYAIKLGNVTNTNVLRELYRALDEVKIDHLEGDYREVVRRIRAEGVELSDRRVIHLLKMVAASALRQGRLEANTGDFWVLRHIWNSPDQIPHLQTIVEPYITPFMKDSESTPWSAERALDTISGDIAILTERSSQLRTDADYTDFLHQAEIIRHELMKHSDKDGAKSHLEKVEGQIEEAMEMLDKKA